MRCQRCEFENLPGSAACFKCGSVLVATSAAPGAPPRARAWRKPFRSLRWAWNRRVTQRPQTRTRESNPLRFAPTGRGVLRLVLALIPGLPQALDRRLSGVAWVVLAWYLLFPVALFLFGTGFGTLLMGVVIALHAYLAVDATGINRLPLSFRLRVLSMLTATACFWQLYMLPQLVFNRYLFIGQSSLSIKAMDVRPDDLLVARLANPPPYPRGSILLVLARSFQLTQQMTLLRETEGRAEAFGQLIAMPGETVRVEGQQFFVNDTALDPDGYPVPAWLKGKSVTIPVPADTYFIANAYWIPNNLPTALVTPAFTQRLTLVPAESIRGRVFLRWLPFRRRGFLEEPK